MARRTPHQPPEVCPACGADVPPSASACPECGADDETGWNEERALYDGIDLPDGEFNYGEFLKKEFGGGGETGRRGRRKWVWLGLVAVVLILLLLALLSRGGGV